MYTDTCTHTCAVHMCAYVCVCVYMCVCVCGCVCLYVDACVCTLCTRMHTHSLTYFHLQMQPSKLYRVCRVYCYVHTTGPPHTNIRHNEFTPCIIRPSDTPLPMIDSINCDQLGARLIELDRQKLQVRNHVNCMCKRWKQF